MTYSLAFGAVGAVVGAYFDDPQDGYAVGSALGGYLDSVTAKINTAGPRLQDRAVQLASWGAPIPIFYGGALRWAGDVVQSSGLIETATKKSSGGKGGPQVNDTQFTYSASVLILFAETILGGRLVELYADNVLVFTAGSDADATSLIISADVATSIRFYDGNADQLPDPLMESLVGVGNCPAYRDRASIVIEAFQLGNFGNRVPNYTAVIAGPSTTVTLHQNICSLTPADPGLSSNQGGAWISLNKIVWLRAHTDPTDFGTFEIFKSDNGGEVSYLGYKTLGISFPHEAKPVNTQTRSFFEAVEYASDLSDQRLHMFDPTNASQLDDSLVEAAFIDFAIAPSSDYWLASDGHRMTAWDEDSEVFAFGIRDTSARYFGERVSIYKNSLLLGEYIFRTVGAGSSTVLCALAANSGRVFALIYDSVSGHMHLVILAQSDGSVISDFEGPIVAPDYGTDIMESMRTDGSTAWAWVDGANTAWKWDAAGTVTVLSTTAFGLTDSAGSTDLVGGPMCYIDDNMLIARGAVLFNSDSAHPIFRCQLVRWNSPTPTDIAVADIIANLCTRKGVTSIDTSTVTDVSHGYLVSKRMTDRSAIDFLLAFYGIDIDEQGPTVRFVKRGGAPVATLTPDDIGAHEGDSTPSDSLTSDPFQITRVLETDLPRSVTVLFTDRSNAYQPGSVKAQRLNTTSEQDVTIDVTALALDPDEAAQFAQVTLYQSWVGRETYKFCTTIEHDDLHQTDVILYDDGEVIRRMRLTKKNDRRGLIEWEAIADDPYVVIGNAIGGGTRTAAIITIPSETSLYLLDIPIIRDADNDAGFYAKQVPANPGRRWTGSTLFQTDIDVTAIGTVFNASEAGFAIEALQSWGGANVFDETSFVDVILNSSMLLASYSPAQVFGGLGWYLIGGEIVAAKNAVLVASTAMTNTYRLSGLLRGLRGTDPTQTHLANETVISLELAGMLRVDKGTDDIGHAHDYVATTIGLTLDLSEVRTFTNTGKGLKPFAVVDIGIDRESASPSVRVYWNRRSRLAGNAAAGMLAPLGEVAEAYSIDVFNGAMFVGTYATTIPSVVLPTTAPGYRVDIYQLSAVVGRGFRASVTL